MSFPHVMDSDSTGIFEACGRLYVWVTRVHYADMRLPETIQKITEESLVPIGVTASIERSIFSMV